MRTIEPTSNWSLAPASAKDIHPFTPFFVQKASIPVDPSLPLTRLLQEKGVTSGSDAWPEEASWQLQATFHLSQAPEGSHFLLQIPARTKGFSLSVGESRPLKIRAGARPLFLDVSGMMAIGSNQVTLTCTGFPLAQVPSLVTSDRFLLEDEWVHITPHGKGWRLHWQATVTAFTAFRQAWKLSVDDKCASGSWDLAEGSNLVEASITLKDLSPYSPENPNLHDIFLTIGEITRTRRVGFASYQISENHMPLINGEKRMLCGAVFSGCPEEALRPLLASAKGVRLNVLRVTAFESETFYRECDEQGILVLQDLHDEADFLWQVRRIASHPCLFGWYLPDLPEDDSKQALLRLDRMAQYLLAIMREAKEEHLVLLRYLNGSSFDMHSGWESYPSLATLEKATGEENPNLTGIKVEALEDEPLCGARIFGGIASCFLMPSDQSQAIYLSQCLQACKLKQTVDRWQAEGKSGLCFLDKLFGGHGIGRSLIEPDGKWKLAMYAARDSFLRPVRPFALVHEDGSVGFFVLNETSEPIKNATFTMSLCPYDGLERPIQKKQVLGIPPKSVKQVAVKSGSELDSFRATHLLSLSLSWKDGSAEDWQWLDKPKACLLPSSQIASTFSRTRDGIEITIVASRPAMMVALDQGTLQGTFSRNWFPLFGRTSVIFQSDEAYPIRLVKQQLSIHHLAAQS